ncbi:C40 family peptidase [Carboxylicivirga sp. RSCT41]|uniref:C40 family peptidase n=1 Tax=Carboxylicivirga agarovorans TaxID=3417570 RepID=UPI003D346677
MNRILLLSALVIFSLTVNAQKRHKLLKEYKKGGIEKAIDVKEVQIDDVIGTARYFLGIEHKMGGTDHKGLDCSGLVYASFKKHGIQVPRSSSEQGRVGKFIGSKNRLQYGDLVFFHMDWDSEKIVNHVGIYLGDDEFIHVSTSKGCIISRLDNEVWKKSFLFATRVW